MTLVPIMLLGFWLILFSGIELSLLQIVILAFCSGGISGILDKMIADRKKKNASNDDNDSHGDDNGPL